MVKFPSVHNSGCFLFLTFCVSKCRKHKYTSATLEGAGLKCKLFWRFFKNNFNDLGPH